MCISTPSSRLVEHPAAWRWSSYPGYAHRGRRLEWVASDELLASWGGEFGGPDPAGAYRRYVTHGLVEPPPSPWSAAHHGWVLGSKDFVARLRDLVRGARPQELRRETRLIQGFELGKVREVVCSAYQVAASELSRRGSPHEARAALAYLAREHTEATHRELAGLLGVSRPDSVPNLTRRFARMLAERREMRERLEELQEQLRTGEPMTCEKTRNLA